MPEKSKKRKLIHGGLQGKIFRLCIMLVLMASIGFAVLGIIELQILRKKAEESGIKQAEIVSGLSKSSMINITNDNMQKLAGQTAYNAYWEIWIMQHDAVTLANQVQDVLEHPEEYLEKEVLPPRKENDGELSLQLLMPEGADPSAEDMSLVRKLAGLAPTMQEMIRDNNYEFLDKDSKKSANWPFQSDYVAGPICLSYHILTKPAAGAGFCNFIQEVILRWILS